jgi:hypothetical protein
MMENEAMPLLEWEVRKRLLRISGYDADTPAAHAVQTWEDIAAFASGEAARLWVEAEKEAEEDTRERARRNQLDIGSKQL